MQDTHELRTVVDVMEAHERRLGTIAEATTELNALMSAVRATGKGGTLTIKFKVEKDKNDEEALTIVADVTSTIPKPERRKALVYHDAETQTFSRTDPRQLELLREREAEAAERAEAIKAAGAVDLQQVGRGPIAATVTG